MDGYNEMGIISSRYHPDRFDRPEGKEGGAAFTEKRPPEFWAIRGREARSWPELIEGCGTTVELINTPALEAEHRIEIVASSSEGRFVGVAHAAFPPPRPPPGFSPYIRIYEVAPIANRVEIDPALDERLRALGYLGTEPTPGVEATRSDGLRAPRRGAP